jgi:hypothetical protein
MSSISSMEQLEAVPIDQVVRVDGNDWTRTAKGLSREGVDLNLIHFEGRVRANAVIDVASLPVAAGEWWIGATRSYYVWRVTDRRVHYSSFRGAAVQNWSGSSAREAWDSSRSMHRASESPRELASQIPAIERAGTLAAQVADNTETIDRLLRENAELRQSARTVARKPREVLAGINNIRHHLDQIAQLMEE